MLSRLRAGGFRNLAAVDWSPGEGCHLLLGGNGAGKTSLLEAVYLVATTRSFRTSRLRDCLAVERRRSGEDAAARGFRVEAEVESMARSRLRLVWSADEGMRRERDGKAVPLADYLETLPVVVWSSRETEVLSGAPELRRRLIDSGLVSRDLDRLATLSGFRRCLDQKKELLRRGLGGLGEWNRLFAEAAAELSRFRAQWIGALQERLGEARRESGLDLPELTLDYRPSPEPALDGPEALYEALERRRDEERETRRCLVGPHRDRLGILWGGSEVAEVASAGERKAFGLLLLAAQAALLAESGRPPLLLADDVDTELDPARFAALWEVLSGRGPLLASSNRPQVWRSLRVDRTWSVEDGVIRS